MGKNTERESEGWTDRERKTKERQTDRATRGERERGEGGERLMLGPWGSLAQSAGHASERMC